MDILERIAVALESIAKELKKQSNEKELPYLEPVKNTAPIEKKDIFENYAPIEKNEPVESKVDKTINKRQMVISRRQNREKESDVEMSSEDRYKKWYEDALKEK